MTRSDLPRPALRYLWLLYTLFVFTGPLMGRGGAVQWTLAVASIAAFLPPYFAYWAAMEARRPGRAAVMVAVIALIGIVLVPFTTGASTYLVYAAAMVPFVASARRALAAIVFFAATMALVSIASMTYEPRVWWIVSLPVVLMIVAIGGANVLYAENVRRRAQVSRAREEVDEMAAVAERERISRDLHDLLGHTLSVTALKSELASRLSTVDPARAAAEIRDVEQISRNALSEVRAAVEGFRSRGYAGELRNAARALDAAGVRFDDVTENVRMPPRHEGVLALALREATTNVIRHARASHCRAELRADGQSLILTVRDDGAGAVAYDGHGLTGMRERATALGGAVTVENDGGTRVTMRLPL